MNRLENVMSLLLNPLRNHQKELTIWEGRYNANSFNHNSSTHAISEYSGYDIHCCWWRCPREEYSQDVQDAHYLSPNINFLSVKIIHNNYS